MTTTSLPDRRFLSFQEYIDRQTHSRLNDENGTPLYAHPVDEWIIRSLNSTPARAAIEKAVDALISLELGQYLSNGIFIDERSFPDLFEELTHSAATLDIPVPHAVVNDGGDMGLFNGFTAGTDEYSFVCLSSGLSEYFSREEACYVIGHECGHIASRHMLYHTLAWALANGVLQKLLPRIGYAVLYAVLMPLLAWSRRSEITADRAGLLCCGELAVAERSLMRLIAGYANVDRVDIDDYLRKFKEVQDFHGVSGYQALFTTHPFIPRRIEALRLFARSELYHELTGKTPPAGEKLLSRRELDEQVNRLVK